MYVFGIYDSKAEGFKPPFFARTKGLAVRMVQNALEEKDTELSRYPSDFTLFLLAEFDEETGEYKNMRENLGQLAQYVTNSGRHLEAVSGTESV